MLFPYSGGCILYYNGIYIVVVVLCEMKRVGGNTKAIDVYLQKELMKEERGKRKQMEKGRKEKKKKQQTKNNICRFACR